MFAGRTHKSFEGLSNQVRSVLKLDPLSGHLFVFLNRRRTQVKLLLLTRGGFTIVHKRLERGAFRFPSRLDPNSAHLELEQHELSALLEGLQPSKLPYAKRWSPRSSTPLLG
jgi:transposase